MDTEGLAVLMHRNQTVGFGNGFNYGNFRFLLRIR
jgi:hypothetical protein